jgi:hypothetical protein
MQEAQALTAFNIHKKRRLCWTPFSLRDGEGHFGSFFNRMSTLSRGTKSNATLLMQ